MKLGLKVRYVFHFVVRLKALADFSSICKKMSLSLSHLLELSHVFAVVHNPLKMCKGVF